MNPHSAGRAPRWLDPLLQEIGHLAGGKEYRQAGADHGCGHQGLRRAWVPHRHGGRDRARGRRGRRDHLPVLQEQGRPAPPPLRREDVRAPAGDALRAGARFRVARQAAHLHQAPPFTGGAKSRSRLGADRRAAAKRPVLEDSRSRQAGQLRRSDRRVGARGAGKRPAVAVDRARRGEAGHLRRAGRIGAGLAAVGPADELEEDRGRRRGLAGAGASAREWRQVVKILVTVKRVEDYESKIKVKPDNSWIVTEGVNYRANPFDEIAVEEALRLRDSNMPSEVVAVSIGSAAAQAEIRSALAMGADRGILVKQDGFVDSDAVARLLVKVIEREKP